MRCEILSGFLIVVALTGATVALEPQSSQGSPVPRDLSEDKAYGYSESNPIKVGRLHGGPRDSRMFLSALRGPEGQGVTFKRLGSCCFFDTPNGLIGGKGMLDKYELSYQGLKAPIILYINMYDFEQPKVPVGFSKSK